MLRLVARLLDLAEQAVARGARPEDIAALPVLAHVRRLGEERGEDDLAGIERLATEVEQALLGLEVRDAR
jgi:hypothetical protein